jgi:hypothetical protein
MFEFMKCVVEGIAANGVKGLLELVPGRKYVHDVGAYAIKRYREKNAQKKLEDDVKEMLGAKADAVNAAAQRAVEDIVPQLLQREKKLVTQYVAAIPEAARQSLKRKEDPTGTSLPFGYTIHDPAAVANLLPQHAPRFVSGEFLPGREENWQLERRLGGRVRRGVAGSALLQKERETACGEVLHRSDRASEAGHAREGVHRAGDAVRR